MRIAECGLRIAEWRRTNAECGMRNAEWRRTNADCGMATTVRAINAFRIRSWAAVAFVFRIAVAIQNLERICTPRSAFVRRHFAFRIPPSLVAIPHSAFRIPQS